MIKTKERKTNMSYNCLYLYNNIAILGADSILRHANGEAEFTNQKLFGNKDLHLIWSMTGETIKDNINYFHIANVIMNNQNASILQKLNAIKDIANMLTGSLYETNSTNCWSEWKDFYFDLFVLTVENNKVVAYTLESKNGFLNQPVSKRYDYNCSQFSGVYTDKYQLQEIDFINENINPINKLTKNIQKIIEEDDYNLVGGDVYIATIDVDGNITTYINNKKQEL